ncbi:MAG TPA: hypothetical protein PLD56_00290 [Chitinophagales bacterium]|nr:hypothetical protein [Chitinophagales bacterium]
MSDGRTSNQGGGGGGGGGISGSGSAGQVSFFDSSTSITSSPNLTFDGSSDFRVAGKNPYYIGGSTVVAIADGGTSATTANAAFNNLAPSQTGNAGKILTTDGTNTSWTTSGTYTDEQAQDAVGSILTDTSTIDFTYNDVANQITAVIVANSITNSLISPTAAIDATKIANGSVSNTEFQYLDGVTSAIQTQIDSKINLTEKGAANGVATLDGATRVPLAQIPTSVFINAGTWNASTNTPTLANGTGTSGYFYVVSVAGTVNFGAGNITFAVGDWVYYNGSIWQKSINSNLVTSVNGQQGVVNLTTSDISEGSNLYYTDERAQDAVGNILADTATIAFTYNDSGNIISANVIDSSITFTKIQNIATGTILGRNTAGTGVVEVLTTLPLAVQNNITQLGTISSGTWNGSIIGATFGGTGFSTYTLGDTLYSSATNTLSKLAGNTTTTRQFLRQVGNGTVSAAPAWDTVTKTDVGLSNVENTALSTWPGSTNLVTLGTITTGTWNGAVIPLAFGGTNANLTASNGGIFYSTATAGAILAGVATAGRILQSGATAAPTWSASTYPSTAGSSGQIIISNGTNFIGSTALYPNTTTINQLLYSSSANTIAGLATANNGVLITDSGGVPSISSTLPNAVQDNITRLGTVTSGTWNATVIGVTFGGTGISSYAVGDLLYANTTTTLAKLADVATGNALISGGVGVAPSYGKIGLTTHVSGTLGVTNGGTGLNTIAQGDILYGSASNTIAALAKDTNATRYLSNTGTSNNPAWSQIDLTNGVTGTLPFGNGGTGFSSYTDGQLLIGNTGTGGLSRATLTAGSNITITNGSGTITIAATGSTGYSTVQEEGSNLTQRATLNFIGSAITATDNAGSTRTDVTIDSTVNALASLSTTGLIARTGSGTLATRTITAGSANLTVSNGDGVSGNPTVDIGSSVVTLTGTQTLSNKTLDNTTTLTIKDNAFTIVDNADTTKAVNLHVENVTTATTRDWFFPDSSDAFVGISTPQSISSKIFTFSTIGNTNAITIKDNSFSLQDDGDTTKQAVFQLSGITTATTRTLTVPNASGTLALTSDLTGYVTSVSGTSNRITSTGGTTPVIDIAATYVGQTSITTLGTIGTGTWNATAIAATVGGTGQTSYAVGDLLYASTTTALSKLADVAAGSYLRSGGVSTAPVWSTTTLPNSATTGDLIYASASNVYSNLAGVATGNALISGGVGTAPSWGKIGLTTHISGILPEANGGTNQSTYTTGDLLYASASNTLSKLADVAAGSYLRSGGVATAPVWSTTTLPNSATTGDLLYASASNTYSNLAAVATGKELRSAGTGTAPTWSTAGGSVITFYLNTGQNFVANGYIGLAGDGSSTLNVNIVPWVVPVAGTLSFLRVYGFSNAPSNLHIKIYKASNATSPSYATTTLDALVSSGTNSGSDTTHSVSVSAGELVVAFCDTAWSTFGASINVMFLPT